MIWNVTGYLWRFVWFRFIVLGWVRDGWIGHRWLAVNTPLAFALRAVLDMHPGNSELVASLDEVLRAQGRRMHDSRP